MRGICVADIHGDVGMLVKLRNAIQPRDIEYFFLLGDYSRGFKDAAENKADIRMVLDALDGYRVKALPGNCDQKESVEAFRKAGANLHNSMLALPEVNIIGLGGSNMTPFNTPFEYSEEEIADNLNALHAMIDNDNPLVVMSHFPPKDTNCDVIAGGIHVGSQALKDFIDSKQPDLVLCSHIHEAGGTEDKVGKTKVLNIGRLADGRAYILEAEGDIRVELFTG